jgi:tetratricopeptide (TPR) repeat protein
MADNSTPGPLPATRAISGTQAQSPDEARLAARMSATAPVAVPGYEVLGELGRGGMGVVYKARQLGLNRDVALKMVLGEGVADEKAVIRFLAEAEAVAAVRHSHVVQVYDYGEHDGRPFMALEFCPGGTLADRLKNGPLDPRRAAGLVGAVAAGVAAAHEQGIVHRDLKPGNVLFDEHGGPKVADFGLAKRRGADLTRTGAVLGTPAYMSPEQAGGGAGFVGPPADVWALGVILYECLTGARPFHARDVEILLLLIRADAPPPPRKLAPQVPRDLETVCLKCLAKDPADRYPTARELADDLDRFLAGKPVKARPIGMIPRATRWVRRNPVVAGLLAVVLGVTAALVVVVAQRYGDAVERKEQAEAFAREKADLARAEQTRREEAERLRVQATEEAERANQVSEFLAGMFRSSDPLDIFGKDVIPPNYEKLRNRTARDFLDEADKQFADGLKNQPLVRAKLLLTIGNSYRNLGEFPKAGRLLTQALELRLANLPADHPDVSEVEFALGQLSIDIGDYFDAEVRFRRLLAAQTRPGADPKTLSITRGFMYWAMTMLERPGIEPLLRKEGELRKELFGPTHRETLFLQIGVVAYLLNAGRAGDVLPLANDLLAGLRAQPDDQFRAAADALIELQAGVTKRFMADEAGFLRDRLLRQAEESIKLSLKKGEAVVPAEHIYVALARYELGAVYDSRGDWPAARAEYTTAVTLARKTCGLAHPKVLILVERQAEVLTHFDGGAAEARKLFDEVADANLQRFGAGNYWRALLLMSRAQFEAKAGAPDEAAAFARQALALKDRLIPNRSTARALYRLGVNLDWGKHADLAAELLALARPLEAELYGDPSPELCLTLRAQGVLLFRQKRDEGAGLIRRAAAMADALGSRLEDRNRVWVLRELGRIASFRGEWADAQVHLSRAAALARTSLAPGSAARASLLVDYAGALVGAGRYAEAVPVVDDCRRVLLAGKPSAADRAVADRLAAAVRLAAGDADGYREAVRTMAGRSTRSGEADVLTQFVWAAGLCGGTAEWDPADAATRLAATLTGSPKNNWGHRGRALALVRAGDLAGAEAALTNVTGTPRPADAAIRGLIAVARDDAAAASDHLRRAEGLTASQAPSAADPFAYAETHWVERLDAAILLDELRRAIDPGLAPRPQSVPQR